MFGRNNAGKEWLVLGEGRPPAERDRPFRSWVGRKCCAGGQWARFWADCCSPNSLSFDLNRDGDRKLSSVVSGPRNHLYRTR
jgi:hypothetical protein